MSGKDIIKYFTLGGFGIMAFCVSY